MRAARWKVRFAAALATALGAAVVVVAGENAQSPRIGDCGLDLDGRDQEVRPQDDFFHYANGTWLKEFEIPEDLPGFGSFTELFLQSERQVREIIEEIASTETAEGSEERKIADLYNGFLDTEAIEEAGLVPLEDDFARIRSAGSPEEIAALLGEYSRIGTTTPFNYYVDQDAKSPDGYIAHFIQSGIGLPDRDYYLQEDNERFANARKARRDYLTKLLEIAGEDEASAKAGRVFALEKRLAEAHWPSEDTRDVDATYNKMSAREIHGLAPGFPWSAYLEGIGLDRQRAYIVTAPSAYAGMAKVFADTPVGVWRQYLVCSLIDSHAAWLPKEIDDTRFRFTSEAFTGSREQRAREKRAVQFVNRAMGRAVGRIYVDRHFSGDAKRQVEEMVANLLAALGERIDALAWMSDKTKARAREKLEKFTVKIGYPDEWRDYSGLEVTRGDLVGNARRAARFESERNLAKLGAKVNRKEWLMNPQTVNAYYNAPMNEIVFPAAILQPPFFDPNADPAVNYGGIGAVIGHEIGHGFDDQGRKSDGDGVQRDWWTEEDAERFRERADRLVAQYDGFSPLEGVHVNGRLTLGENIGDLGGLEIAFHAYRLSLGGAKAPIIDGLTGNQRFFLGYSQIWRGKMRDELTAMLVAANPHSPVEFRVNGAVRNVDAWYRAFHVEPGDAMYLPPEERVRIW